MFLFLTESDVFLEASIASFDLSPLVMQSVCNGTDAAFLIPIYTRMAKEAKMLTPKQIRNVCNSGLGYVMKVVDVQELSVENLVLQGKLCRLVFSSLLCRHSIDRSPYSVQVFEYDAFVEANELVYKCFFPYLSMLMAVLSKDLTLSFTGDKCCYCNQKRLINSRHESVAELGEFIQCSICSVIPPIVSNNSEAEDFSNISECSVEVSNNYKTEAIRAVELFNEHLVDTESWNLGNTEQNVATYSKILEPDFSMFKSIAQVKKSALEVSTILLRNDSRKLLHPMIKTIKPVFAVNASVQIEYLGFYSSWPVKPRDFCVLRVLQRNESGVFTIVYKSAMHSSCPVNDEKIRGEIILEGYQIKPISECECEVICLWCFDLKNESPDNYITTLVYSQSNSLSKLSTLNVKLEGQNVWENVIHSNLEILKVEKLDSEITATSENTENAIQS